MQEFERLQGDQEKSKRELEAAKKKIALKLLRDRKRIKALAAEQIEYIKIPWYKRFWAKLTRKVKHYYFKFLQAVSK